MLGGWGGKGGQRALKEGRGSLRPVQAGRRKSRLRCCWMEGKCVSACVCLCVSVHSCAGVCTRVCVFKCVSMTVHVCMYVHVCAGARLEHLSDWLRICRPSIQAGGGSMTGTPWNPDQVWVGAGGLTHPQVSLVLVRVAEGAAA